LRQKIGSATGEASDAGGVARPLEGPYHLAVYVVAIVIALGHVYFNSYGLLGSVPRNALHMATMALVVFLVIPATRRSPKHRFTLLDVLLGAAVLVCGWYIFTHYLLIHRQQFSIPSTRDLVFAALAVALLLEAARRAAGWVIPAIALFFIFYAIWFGQFIPGPFYYSPTSYERLLFRLALTDEAIFGIVANISSTYVFTFILFGAFLIKSGAGAFVIDLALALAGRIRGGPAHAAVVASGMIGSITGSAVANTVTSGAFTIPLMKRIGYAPKQAAGIEAAASTGGQIMPPIMGAGAFIMSQFTGIPYIEIVAVALLPAILYFLSVSFFIYLSARRDGIGKLEGAEVPELGRVLREGAVFFVPIGCVVGTLIYGYTPLFAGLVGIVSVIVASWFTRNYRMGPKAILDALASGTRNAAATAVVLLTAGIVVGIAGLTGIGITFSGMIVGLAGDNLFLAVVLIAFASLILGMGLPVSAAYVMLAILAAPALTQMGVTLIAAHMLIFWYSQDSNVTPPIALAAYAAAGIAGSKPMATAFTAWKYAKGLYFIPLLFVYSPILFTGSYLEALVTTVFAAFGLFCAAVVFEGYLVRRTGPVERLGFLIAAVGLFWPSIWVSLPCLALFGALLAWQLRGARTAAAGAR
jgi:TRAP transporter 4TM/12TM fusion protein